MSKTTFAYWWHNIGSGMIPGKNEEQEQHAERVAEAAWDGAIENSAAPELLAALKDMLSGWRYIRQDAAHQSIYGVGWDRAQSAAESAIAKAEGRDA